MGIKTFIEKIRGIKTRNKLVNKYINGKYDLEVVVYKTEEVNYNKFDCVNNTISRKRYSTTMFKNGHFFEDGYYYSYDEWYFPRRYSVKKLRKIVKKYIDLSKKYEFDVSYLAYIAQLIKLTLYI